MSIEFVFSFLSFFFLHFSYFLLWIIYLHTLYNNCQGGVSGLWLAYILCEFMSWCCMHASSICYHFHGQSSKLSTNQFEKIKYFRVIDRVDILNNVQVVHGKNRCRTKWSKLYGHSFRTRICSVRLPSTYHNL